MKTGTVKQTPQQPQQSIKDAMVNLSKDKIVSTNELRTRIANIEKSIEEIYTVLLNHSSVINEIKAAITDINE